MVNRGRVLAAVILAIGLSAPAMAQQPPSTSASLTVELVKPPKDIRAEPVTIPAGKSEATLVLEAANEAKLGVSSNLVVKVTASFKGKEVRQESKLSLAVAK